MDDTTLEQFGKRFSPWQRGRDVKLGRTWEYVIHDFDEPFDFITIDENIDLDISTKRVVQRVSMSVVSIECRVGDQHVLFGSGTIIECNVVENQFAVIILTSASIVNQLSNTEFKMIVRVFGGELLYAELLGVNIHYNVATVKAMSYRRLPVASIRRLEMPILFQKESGDVSLQGSHSRSSSFKISLGDNVIALGRFHFNCEIMAAPGIFRIDSLDFDCKELCVSTCRITKCGIGGPVVNSYGEIIGISFYDRERTLFLPINVAVDWWRYFKENKMSICPWLGVEVVELALAGEDVARKVFQHFPRANGVIVTKVMPLSPAEQVGICRGDVITKCANDVISSSLKLLEAIWENVGTYVHLAVIKGNDPSSTSHLRVKVGEISEEQFNKWPLAKAEKTWTNRVRSWHKS